MAQVIEELVARGVMRVYDGDARPKHAAQEGHPAVGLVRPARLQREHDRLLAVRLRDDTCENECV